MGSSRQRRSWRPRIVLVGALAAGAVLAGCSSSADQTSATTTTTPPTTGHVATTAAPTTTTTRGATTTTVAHSVDCNASQLAGSVEGTQGAAGQFEVTIALKNVSGSACPTYGYPGLQLVGAGGSQLQTTTEHGGTLSFEDIQPASITLAAGATAWFNLGYSDIPAGGETSCPASATLQVIPPNDTAHLVIPLAIDPCDNGTLHESPLFASGSAATQTTAPPTG